MMHAASNAKWSAISQASRVGCQLVAMVVLARILPAEDFGVIAMAMVVTGFASLFRDMGTASAIIQKHELSDSLLDTVFWFNIALGLLVAIIVVLLSPAISWGFNETRLEQVLWLLALVFPVTSLGSVHLAVLERSFRFRSIAIIESIAAFSGLGCVIWAAMDGWGVYSLAFQTLVIAIITSMGFYWISNWRPGRQWSTKEMRGIIGFSGNLFGFNVFNYFARNADNILIGRFLGAADLGYYTMAYRLMLWPLQNISNVVGRTLFPHFSRLQHDHTLLANDYLRATAAIVLITAPLMFGLFALRDLFVSVVLGDNWAPVADILTWLAIVGFIQSIGTTVGPLYLATGRTDVMLKWGIAAGIVATLAFSIGLQWGVEGVAVAYAIASTIIFLPSLIVPFRLIGLKVLVLIKRIRSSMLSACIMAFAIVLVDAFLPLSAGVQSIRLALLTLFGVMVYFLLCRKFQPDHLRLLTKAIFSR